MVVRKDHLRAQAFVAKQVAESDKIDVRYLTSVVRVEGDGFLKSITFRNNETGEETTETYDEGRSASLCLRAACPRQSFSRDSRSVRLHRDRNRSWTEIGRAHV